MLAVHNSEYAGRLSSCCGAVAEVESFLGCLKDTPVVPGAEPVRVPGEGGAGTSARRLREDIIVRAFTWDALRRLADDLDVVMPATTA